MASAPRSVLCGTMPRMVCHTILDGARKWKGPRTGLVQWRFLRYASCFTVGGSDRAVAGRCRRIVWA